MYTQVLFFYLISIQYIMARSEPIDSSFRSIQNQQGIQNILQTIESRLRNIEQLYSVRYLPRLESKIENLDSKLGRIESFLDVKFDKINDDYKATTLKQDLFKEHVTRKLDSSYEGFNHRLGYIEGKFDMGLIKLQTKIENNMNKIEQLENILGTRLADMENEITDTIQGIEELKMNTVQVDEKITNISKSVEAVTHEAINKEFKILSKSLIEINNNTNIFTQCKENINVISQNISSKVTTLQEEIAKNSMVIESTIKDNMALTNVTRREMQDGLRSLLSQIGRKITNYLHEGNTESAIDNIAGLIQRKFSEVGRKIDGNYQNMMLAQNLFLESCHRIQLDEPQLEAKVTLVLEKLLDSITNKSSSTYREIQILQDLVKSHDSKIYNSVGHTRNTVLELAEKSNAYKQEIIDSILDIKQKLDSWLNEFKNTLNSSGDKNNKLIIFHKILQDIQDHINELENKNSDISFENISKNNIEEILDFIKENIVDKGNITMNLSNESANIAMLENYIQNVYETLHKIELKLRKPESNMGDLKKNYEKLWNHRINKIFSEMDGKANESSTYELENEKNSTESLSSNKKLIPDIANQEENIMIISNENQTIQKQNDTEDLYNDKNLLSIKTDDIIT